MAGQSGRVVCPRCGSNNFETVTVCWKCGAPLASGRGAAQSQVGSVSAVAQPQVGAGGGWSAGPQLASTIGARLPMPANTRTANRAAIWLGILCPYFGLPIALAFMMCDDPRRQEVGKICLLWSTISGVFHLMLLGSMMLGARDLFGAALNAAKAAGSRGGGMGGYDTP